MARRGERGRRGVRGGGEGRSRRIVWTDSSVRKEEGQTGTGGRPVFPEP